MTNSEQLHLSYESGPVREVSWFNNTEPATKGFLFWKRTVADLIIGDNGLVETTSISAAQIDQVKDPNLRYALRFADAANAVGFVQDDSWSSHAHHVSVNATDQGYDSKFLGATYTGVVGGRNDTFLQNLRDCAPLPQVEGMTTVLVRNTTGGYSTRFWVNQAKPE